MNSTLTITLRPPSPRTIAPLEVKVAGEGAEGARVVVSSAGRDLFPLAMKDVPGGRAGTFWLQEPGDYRVRAVTGETRAALDFHVAQQAFLGFETEFGLFLAALAVAGGGLILWFRNRKKAGSTSASSPS